MGKKIKNEIENAGGETLALPFRETIKTGAETKCYVISYDGQHFYEPVYQKRSRTGAHGVDIFEVEFPVWVVTYERSNSGREYLTIELFKSKNEVERYHTPPKEIIDALDFIHPKWRHILA